MSEHLYSVLDDLVPRFEDELGDWEAVRRDSRLRQVPLRGHNHGRRRLVAAVAVVVLLVLTGAAIAAGIDLLTQQERFHERTPDDPQRQGQIVEVVSGEQWALLAWNSDAGLCLDFAIQENSTFSCGFPVRGANPGSTLPGQGRPTHAVAGAISGGNLVGGDGKATIFGVAALQVARVTVELSDGRILEARLYDAPRRLNSAVRFFVLRLPLGELERGLERNNPVHAYNAYNGEGSLIERLED